MTEEENCVFIKTLLISSPLLKKIQPYMVKATLETFHRHYYPNLSESQIKEIGSLVNSFNNELKKQLSGITTKRMASSKPRGLGKCDNKTSSIAK